MVRKITINHKDSCCSLRKKEPRCKTKGDSDSYIVLVLIRWYGRSKKWNKLDGKRLAIFAVALAHQRGFPKNMMAMMSLNYSCTPYFVRVLTIYWRRIWTIFRQQAISGSSCIQTSPHWRPFDLSQPTIMSFQEDCLWSWIIILALRLSACFEWVSDQRMQILVRSSFQQN